MKNLVVTGMFLVGLGLSTASAQDPLVAARELYASAAYEDALDVLKKMDTPSGAEITSTDGEVLKAFCLLALRRQDEAKTVIETIITERPTYVPGEDEASPRVRTAFQDVRRKLLPTVARQLYASARADYDAKNLVSAGAKFSELLKVLADPDLGQDQTLADLRVLAEGFRAVTAAASNVATAADTQARRSDSPGAGSPAGDPKANGSGSISAAAGGNVSPVALLITPPVAIKQQMPPWHGDGMNARNEFSGAIDLVIDEQGKVESVSIRKSIHPLYDALLLEAAKSWTYQPAKRGDQPIKFQKIVVVKLTNP